MKGFASLALRYRKLEADMLIGYCDADWAGDRDDRHSTSRNVFLMAGGPISWLSKKQAIVALSTSEAEYVALCIATQEAAWLRRLLADLKVLTNVPTLLMEDNQGAIAIAPQHTFVPSTLIFVTTMCGKLYKEELSIYVIAQQIRWLLIYTDKILAKRTIRNPTIGIMGMEEL